VGRTGRAKRKGEAWAIISNFPEKAKLDEICKFCNFSVKPMVLSDEGILTEEVVKPAPAPKRRFR
jgi:ATP-dependent RNA helicase DeaD